MAAESSARSAAAVGGGPSAESYIGSLISLTSKFEIRYEGILYTINTQDSSIGLRNVRSFGTEGRRKDGPQIPASHKIYEFIVFRGSDIKDVQVKSSPPVPSQPLHNDPAIIQSHYSSSPPVSTDVPSTGSGTVADFSSQATHYGLERSTFQGNLPLYQPGGSLGPWGSPPPTANGSAQSMPMYWQGYYTSSGGPSHVQQPPFLHPTPGVTTQSAQPLQQLPLQHSVSSTPLSTTSHLSVPSHFLPSVGSTMSLVSSTVPSTSAPTSFTTLAPEMLHGNPLIGTLPAVTVSSTLSFVPPTVSSIEYVASKSQGLHSVIGSKIISGHTPTYQNDSHSTASIVHSSTSGQIDMAVPLVTPDQLLPPVRSAILPSPLPQTSDKDVEVKPIEARTKPLLPNPVPPAPAENNEPLLPLPLPTDSKPNGAASHSHHSYRGRGRGRGYGFTEDFDFIAMNEKFNKDEVWGHLGKGKGQSRGEDRADDISDDDSEARGLEVKPTYVKDDFFDTLSCNTLDRGTRNGRTKFSEQFKIDVETFGDFPRHRPTRGGGRWFRGGGGGGRSRGSYYGRGYGYVGRGRGHYYSNRTS